MTDARRRRTETTSDAELIATARRKSALYFDERVRLAKLRQAKRDEKAAAEKAKHKRRRRQ